MKESLDLREGVAVPCHIFVVTHGVFDLKVCFLFIQLWTALDIDQVLNVEDVIVFPVKQVDSPRLFVKLL